MDIGPVDFNFFLNRKYALLAQQADAGTQNAASGAITSNAQAGALTAAAGLDRVRTKLLPGESAAGIAEQQARTRLLGEQANVVAPESAARIGQIGADTRYTLTQDKVLTKDNFEGLRGGVAGLVGSALPSLTRPASAAQPFRLSGGISTTRPPRLPNESNVDYMDRTGWGA